MRTHFMILALLLAGTAAFAQKDVIHDADADLRKVTGFEALEVSSAIDLQISQGDDAVAVSARDQESREAIKTEVSGGVLRIYIGKNYNLRGNNTKSRVYVSARTLRKISASGACDVSINGEFKTDDMFIRLSGASDLKGRIVAGSLKIDLSGASDMVLKGSADDLNIEASGASNIKGFDFSAGNCQIRASGASDMELTINKVLNATASGAANIYYKGAGQVGDVRTSGASHIAKR
jgi:Putative auto-transporter adhesin, head GIN domain